MKQPARVAVFVLLAAACGPAREMPQIVVKTRPPGGVALDAEHVYWVSNPMLCWTGTIYRAPKAGGAPLTLLDADRGAGIPTVRDGYVYWAAQPDAQCEFQNSVQRMPAGGGDPEVLVEQHHPYVVSVDADYVYWGGGSAGVWRAPIEGGVAAVLVPNGPGGALPGAPIIAHGEYIYWGDGSWTVARAPRQGGEATVLWEAAHTPDYRIGEMALQADHIYWTYTYSYPPVNPAAGRVYRMKLDGSNVEVLVEGELNPWAIATDETHVYWANMEKGTKGSIKKVPLAGGAVETVADGLDYPNGIAVDDTHVYWSNLGTSLTGTYGAAIMRVPK